MGALFTDPFDPTKSRTTLPPISPTHRRARPKPDALTDLRSALASRLPALLDIFRRCVRAPRPMSQAP